MSFKGIKNKDKWCVSQHCLLFWGQPHEVPNDSHNSIYAEMNERGCFFARWVSEFDVERPTQWWYCIRDEKISLENLTSKQRYRVKHGLKFCRIEHVDAHQYGEGLYNALVESVKYYPKEYKGQLETYEQFSKGFNVKHAD